MGIGTIIFAFFCLPIGKLLGWYVTRNWKHLTVNPKTTFFPKICPMCLSDDASETADEESPDRQTKNYIVAQRLEHWSASIPYCSRCKLRLDYGRVMAISVGAVCALAALVLLPPDNINMSPMLMLGYILFGYPAYAAITPLRKGVLLKSAFGKDHLTVAIRDAKYYEAWCRANERQQARAQAVPLAGGKGIWQR